MIARRDFRRAPLSGGWQFFKAIAAINSHEVL